MAIGENLWFDGRHERAALSVCIVKYAEQYTYLAKNLNKSKMSQILNGTLYNEIF